MTMLPLVYRKITTKQHHGAAGQWVQGGALLEKSQKRLSLRVFFIKFQKQVLVPSSPSCLVKKSLRGTFSSPYTKKSLETNTPCIKLRHLFWNGGSTYLL